MPNNPLTYTQANTLPKNATTHSHDSKISRALLLANMCMPLSFTMCGNGELKYHC